jgi:hypothetical protein
MADVTDPQTELARLTSEARTAVLDLQKLAAAPDVQAVRSCTSCLSDSCNKPAAIAASPTG